MSTKPEVAIQVHALCHQGGLDHAIEYKRGVGYILRVIVPKEVVRRDPFSGSYSIDLPPEAP